MSLYKCPNTNNTNIHPLMAPPKKQNFPSQPQKTKLRPDKPPSKSKRTSQPLNSEGKEEKAKPKPKENDKKTIQRKKTPSENRGQLISSQNRTDQKPLKKKLVKKSSRPISHSIKLGHSKLVARDIIKLNSQEKSKQEASKPTIESLRTKHLTVELITQPQKTFKVVPDKPVSAEKYGKIRPAETVNTITSPIKPPPMQGQIIPFKAPTPAIVPPVVTPAPVVNVTPVSVLKSPANYVQPVINEIKLDNTERAPEVQHDEVRRLTTEMQMKLAVHITKVIQDKKIFAMSCANFSSIKTALLKRGWIQKYACEEPSLRTGAIPTDPEGQFTQRMLRNVPINFVWVYAVHDWNDIKPQTLVNRFPRAVGAYTFTTKIGLNQYLQQAHWYNEKDISEVKFPRTYSILTQEDLLGFIEDYVMTACMCLLKLVVMIIVQAEHNIFKDGDIPLDVIDFAVDRCREFVAFKEHRDIDKRDEGVKANEDSVKWFLGYFYRLVHDGAKFQTASYLQTQGIYLSAKSALQDIQKFWPELKLDGFKNLWLLKQSNLNCGRGVRILTTLDAILNIVGEVKGPRYVIQKYIERPLLIHDTKFDIRQWILLTGVNPIQIWMYDECYLRFSSQVFSLSDTSESIHLCNNVIQKKYKNAKRHPSLPAENMWDGTRFKKYLQDIGEGDKWDKVIYPGMKRNIVATIMSAQESMIERANSFELYGIDFMLTEDYKPWLIEVNSSPAMGPTTSVTGRLCGQCLTDIIKVVIDRRYNSRADTGLFKLIYKQESGTEIRSLPLDFALNGRKITLMTRSVSPFSKRYSNKQSTGSKNQPTIVDLSTTVAGRYLSITDSESKSLISKESILGWSNESKFLNAHYTPSNSNIQLADEKQRGDHRKERNKKLRETISDLIKRNVFMDVINKVKNRNSEDSWQEDTNEEHMKQKDTKRKRNVIPAKVSNIETLESRVTEKIEYCVKNDTQKSMFTDDLEKVLINVNNKTDVVNLKQSNEDTKPMVKGNKAVKLLNEPQSQMVDKSTNTEVSFNTLPISKIVSLANSDQLQQLGCKTVEGTKPMNYKIYYNKAKSRFIVDIEDINERYQ